MTKPGGQSPPDFQTGGGGAIAMGQEVSETEVTDIGFT